jgi:putative flippase GtrA
MLLKFKQNGVEIGEVPIETVYIEENHASHFRTVQDSFLVYKFILSYLLSSVISFIVDISLFAILLKIFTKSGLTGPAFALFGKEMTLVQFFATAIARAVSSIVNYTINKKKVFTYEKADEQKKDNTIFKYYALAIPQMFVSAFSVTLLVRLLHIPAEATFITTLLKVCVDVIIFLVNYRVQRSWVFANRPSDNKEIGGKNNE